MVPITRTSHGRSAAGSILLVTIILTSGCALVYEKDVQRQNCQGEKVRVYEWGFLGGLVPVYRKVGGDDPKQSNPPCEVPVPAETPSAPDAKAAP
jgi:hypothetical protein